MNNSAAKVGEIFREAGTAFNKLSEMTMLLHPMGDSQPGGKWTEEEIEMLRGCVHRFAVELNKLSQHIKHRTVTQIRTTLKKKAFEDAGIPVRQVSSTVTNVLPPKPQIASPLRVVNSQSVIGKNAEVTLNMLNASETRWMLRVSPPKLNWNSMRAPRRPPEICLAFHTIRILTFYKGFYR